MTDDLEARIKALEDKLTPPPDKMSTMKATARLKQTLDGMKKEKESQEDVVWKVLKDAAKVPELENENSELRAAKFELEKDKGRLQDDIKQLKAKIKELEDEIERIELQHEVDMTEYDTGDDE